MTDTLFHTLMLVALVPWASCATAARTGGNSNRDAAVRDAAARDGAAGDYDASPAEICGDGVITGSEECDDGNLLDGDGCQSSCAVEPDWSCTGEPSVCALLCGNGQLDSGEECDGDDLAGQTCTTIAGDYTGGTLVCGASCRFDTTGCTLASCGNGIVDASEECDDGNTSNTDACLNSCVAASCGDGYVWSGVEECDDGNTSNTDACLNSCVAASCGDGYVWSGVEECETGACCSASCHFAGVSTQCRASGGECDLAEHCTGNSSSCPADQHVLDGTPCSIGDCSGGICTPCVPSTGTFCSASNILTEYSCHCGQPSGSGWVDVGSDCWQRLAGYCNASHQWTEQSCGCGAPTSGTWVDQGNGCYERLSGLSC